MKRHGLSYNLKAMTKMKVMIRNNGAHDSGTPIITEHQPSDASDDEIRAPNQSIA
jgi:hypothetical protein